MIRVGIANRVCAVSGPMPPLLSVNRSQIVCVSFIGPFVPNSHVVRLEIASVTVPAEEPKQLVNDGAEMNFLGRDKREAVGQAIARLRTEDRIRAGASAVGLELAIGQDQAEQLVILEHRVRRDCWGKKGKRKTKNCGRAACCVLRIVMMEEIALDRFSSWLILVEMFSARTRVAYSSSLRRRL